ncbi:Protein FAM45A-like [Oopsacas minuta]|uniref:Protein FAM45A-like n=1 Tax=Oopsacas minuta TaxID=111878 RepID=A0AAV7JRJ4_9METZ|nr:Protein FAM45A-like [Oopsacas minuta]
MSQLVAIGLIEKDTEDIIEFTWAYPTMDKSIKELLVRKCPPSNLSESNQYLLPYVFSHGEGFWYYMLASKFNNKEYSGYVTDICFTILSKDFHPEKYYDILQALLQTFLFSNSVVTVLKSYLSLFAKKSLDIIGTDKVLNISSYDPRKAFIACPLKPLILQFGIESILLYNAMLLKCRVVVYSSELEALLAFTRTLPLLALHRQNWSIVFPYVDLVDYELTSLKEQPNYVAGFLDSSVENRIDLYDIFVNISSSTITIPEHAKSRFSLSKAHKEIAKLMMEVANDTGKSDQQAIKEINLKTKEMITNLKNLSIQEDGTPGMISYEILKQRKFTATMSNFLFALATVEGLTQL